jgi:hypothetical protein
MRIQEPCACNQSEPSAIVDTAMVAEASTSDLRNPVLVVAVVFEFIGWLPWATVDAGWLQRVPM